MKNRRWSNMACAALSYTGITSAVWDDIVKKVAGYGITLGSDSGTMTSHGITVNWTYNRVGEKLSLQCESLPFFLSCSHVNGYIDTAVKECLGFHNKHTT